MLICLCLPAILNVFSGLVGCKDESVMKQAKLPFKDKEHKLNFGLDTKQVLPRAVLVKIAQCFVTTLVCERGHGNS